jgi:acetyltransferase-like isoleucine patch superfamily enzyme
MSEDTPIKGTWNRLLQIAARFAPGATTLRVKLHRWRGVNIGQDVWIGYDAIIETSYPELVTIKDRASVGIRATIIAHMREQSGVTLEEDVIIGPGALILPGVTVGKGSVVTAGSVVSTSVPPMTLMQGNPAKPVARIGVPLRPDVTLKVFSRNLKPIR